MSHFIFVQKKAFNRSIYFAYIKFISHNNFRRYTINVCKTALFLVIDRNPLLTKVLTDFIYNT